MIQVAQIMDPVVGFYEHSKDLWVYKGQRVSHSSEQL